MLEEMQDSVSEKVARFSKVMTRWMDMATNGLSSEHSGIFWTIPALREKLFASAALSGFAWFAGLLAAPVCIAAIWTEASHMS